MSHRIPVAGPWITALEVEYVTDAVRNAWYVNANKYHDLFECAFAARTGRTHAMALPSCTSALHLALAAMGIGAGDEVIVPETTWIATAAPISYVGAVPVFVDVDPVTWCIHPLAFEAAITPRTKAVITVDLYGNMADYETILPIAARRGIRVIEDCAEAAGATYKGAQAGSFGDVSVFSFHGSKTLTTGEGGMLLTDDSELFARANFLRDHGRTIGDVSFENSEVAFKYKMSSMQAALGLAQLERLDELVQKKRKIFEFYSQRLSHNPLFSLNSPSPNTQSSYWMTSITWAADLGISKRDLSTFLATHFIDTRPFFSPLSSLRAYRHLASIHPYQRINPVSYDLGNHGINLPSHLSLSIEEIDYICEKIQHFMT